MVTLSSLACTAVVALLLTGSAGALGAIAAFDNAALPQPGYRCPKYDFRLYKIVRQNARLPFYQCYLVAFKC